MLLSVRGAWGGEVNGMAGDSLDTAVEHEAQEAKGYLALHHLIRGGCKAAIYLSEKL